MKHATLAFLLGALLATVLVTPASGQSLQAAAWNGSEWNHSFKGQVRTYNPTILADVEFALGVWHAEGRSPCRPKVYRVPDLDGAVGRAEWRFDSPAVGCNLWIRNDYAHPRTITELADTCNIILHEMGHLSGLRHSRNPRSIMYPKLRSPSFHMDSRSRLRGGRRCERRIVRLLGPQKMPAGTFDFVAPTL